VLPLGGWAEKNATVLIENGGRGCRDQDLSRNEISLKKKRGEKRIHTFSSRRINPITEGNEVHQPRNTWGPPEPRKIVGEVKLLAHRYKEYAQTAQRKTSLYWRDLMNKDKVEIPRYVSLKTDERERGYSAGF